LSADLGLDNYGGRLQALLHVPVAGEYTFWVSGDDETELFLETTPGVAKLIASVPGWTSQQEYEKYPEQMSEPVSLEEGVYYIMAMWKEGGGGDNCDAAWQGPGVPERALITGNYLKPFEGVWVDAPSDITAPGDAVQGVPNDGDWPGPETPDLAVDDDTSTKYLHFKGDFDPDPGTGGSGLQITPAAGATIVTGLTLTTANDVPGRDPIAFELSGSNDGIDGPYTLIASGDIVDFAQADEWPRFTMNATPITFDNAVAYTNYQLIFTAIRGPVGGSVNSMQIAEVELLGLAE
jgi:hypothetical protein